MEKNILSMSDEEIAGLGPQAFMSQPEEQEQVQQAEQEPEAVHQEVEEAANEQQPETQDVQSNEEEDEEAEEKEPQVTEPDSGTGADEGKQDPTTPVEKKDEKKPAEPAKKEADTADADAKAQLAKLFAPFKASGREIKVESVDEAIQLMQKGLNYHDKMAALKPSLNVVRLLEREGLLKDPDALNQLIDIHKKNPEAIAKLVKDSGIDLLEVDDGKVAGYKPNQHGLSESESALEDVISDLKQNPETFERVIDFASNRLDQASKQLIIQNPHVLHHFANQMQSGVYDLIQAEVSKQKALGNLKGLNDLQAYDAVGKALNDKGAFNQLASKQTKAPDQVIQPKAKVADPAVAKAKAAAAPAKVAPSGKQGKQDFNPLALSDEEFAALAKKQY